MEWFLEGSETHTDLEGEEVIYTFQYEGYRATLRVAHNDHVLKIELPRDWRITTRDKIDQLIAAFEGDLPVPEINWDNAPAWANFCTIDRNGARHWWDQTPSPALGNGKWELEDALSYPVTLLRHWRGFLFSRPDPNAQAEDNLNAPRLVFDDFIEAEQQQVAHVPNLTQRQVLERAEARRRRLARVQDLAPDMEAEALARAAAEGHPIANRLLDNPAFTFAPDLEEAGENERTVAEVVTEVGQEIREVGEEIHTLAQRLQELEDSEEIFRIGDIRLGAALTRVAPLRNLQFQELPGYSLLVYCHRDARLTPVSAWQIRDGDLQENVSEDDWFQVMDVFYRLEERIKAEIFDVEQEPAPF